MSDLLVRDVAQATMHWLKDEALREGVSISDITKRALDEKVAANAKDWRSFLADIDALREKIGPVPGDSVEFIREWREKR